MTAVITISHTFPLSFQQSVEKRAGLLLLLWSFSQMNPHRRAKFDKVQNDKGGVDGCHDRVVISEIVLRIDANGQQLVRGHAEDVRDDGDQREVGRALVPFPAADRLVGDMKLFRQFFLRHAARLAQRGEELSDGFLFHVAKLLFCEFL